MSTILSDAALSELLASSRQHGVYDDELVKFVQSGQKGVQINLTEGTFAGKKHASVKTGFTSALERTKKEPGSKGATDPLPEGVEVVILAKNDQVYLLRKDLINPAAAAEAEAQAENNGGAEAEQAAA